MFRYVLGRSSSQQHHLDMKCEVRKATAQLSQVSLQERAQDLSVLATERPLPILHHKVICHNFSSGHGTLRAVTGSYAKGLVWE